MAKRKTQLTGNADLDVGPVDVDEPGFIREGVPDYFVNSNGRKVDVTPIAVDFLDLIRSGVEKKYRDQGEPVDVPTYSFTAEGGSIITAEHDEHSLRTDEEKAAWAAHTDAVARLRQEQEQVAIKALCLRGLRKSNFETQEYQDFLKEEAFLGLPEDDLNQRYRFARAHLVISVIDLPDNPPSDASKLAETAVLLGFKGATREQVAQMRSLFRGQMAQAGNGRVGGDAPGRVEAQEE